MNNNLIKIFNVVYQPLLCLAIIGVFLFGRQGGISGMGIGESIQKHSYLPETHTDFIFAIIGEELGFIVGVMVMLAFKA